MCYTKIQTHTFKYTISKNSCFAKQGVCTIKNELGCRSELQANKLVVWQAVNKCDTQKQSFYLNFSQMGFGVKRWDGKKGGTLTLYYSRSIVNAALLISLELFKREIEHPAHNSLLWPGNPVVIVLQWKNKTETTIATDSFNIQTWRQIHTSVPCHTAVKWLPE